MGVYLGQLPPAELARLKAELAETLIAHFCYPRFFDYRTGTLRTRPVDRAKRQEVWLYLSSVDFTAWNRVDLMSPEFQHQIERLLIHFVQRNRNFFGEQGRKRMSDIRMLISVSATSIVQGMRGHLTGQRQNTPPFGSPRPVVSWATSNVTGRVERPWDQLLPATMHLQQQLQELRGEVLALPQSEPEPASAVLPKQQVTPHPSVVPMTPPKAMNGNKKNSNGVSHTPVPEAPVHAEQKLPPAPSNSPLPPVWQTIPASNSVAASNGSIDTAITPIETPVVKPPTMPKSAGSVVTNGAKIAAPEKRQQPVSPSVHIPPSPLPTPFSSPMPQSSVARRVQPSAVPVQPIVPPPISAPVVAEHQEQAPLAVSEEDIAIFEQMRHQLMVWLRIEVVRTGKDIAGQGPLQLLELLRQQENVDETRLQVVSTLLNLANQVIKNEHATLLDYKQALMFHLIHTGRS